MTRLDYLFYQVYQDLNKERERNRGGYVRLRCTDGPTHDTFTLSAASVLFVPGLDCSRFFPPKKRNQNAPPCVFARARCFALARKIQNVR